MINGKILIVEDELLSAENLKAELEQMGYNVLPIISNGKMVIESIKQNVPDLILIDILINGDIDGIETAEIINKKYNIPFIYCTSSIDKKLLKRAKHTNPYGFINKPYSLNEIYSNIEIALSKHKQDQQIIHLSKVLHSVRTINQIINKEQKRTKMLEQICITLTKIRGYQSSWIALFDKNNKMIEFEHVGLGPESEELKQLLKNNKGPECVKRAFETEKTILITNPQKECKNCPLLGRNPAYREMTTSIKYKNENIGVISISYSQNLYINAEERKIFQEVADDIAYALNNLQIQEEKNKSEEILRISEENYRFTLENLLVGVITHASDSSILLSNNEAYNIMGLTLEQMQGKQDIDPLWKFINEDLTIMKIEDYPVNKIISTGKSLSSFIMGIEVPERDFITWVIVNGTPLLNKSKKIDKIIINFLDITTLIKAKKELKEKIDKLEKFNKLTIGRELKMIELKKEINTMLENNGLKPKYSIPNKEQVR